MKQCSEVVELAARWRVTAIALTVILLHVVGLGLPLVNQEGAFNLASAYFRFGDAALIRNFFELDANTLTVPFIGALVSGALHVSPDYGCRLVAFGCLGIFAFSMHSILRQWEPKNAHLLLLLVLINPLLWIFAGRGTADFPPMGIAVASIAIFWRARSNITIAAASSLFALAVIMKYHAALLLPLVAFSPEENQSARFRVMLLVAGGAAATFALLVYNTVVFRTFGFWVTSPKWLSVLRVDPSNIGNNIVRYGGYLALLTAPLSIQACFSSSALPRSTAAKVTIILVACVLGFWLPSSSGEMNFGPLDRWLGDWISGALLCGFFAVFVIGLSGSARSLRNVGVAATIVLFVAVLSTSRPAQRYLILVLPFYYLLVSVGNIRRISIPLILLCVMLIVFAAVAQIYFGVIPGADTPFGPQRNW
ncbi:hypothetical protein [Bradyrhizobium sp. WSM2793]|uniref:hypothetical protein n=1 Tax=Bradyrhizobium sp. WSM2793 TaxID=1038866 RepID=UPI00037B375F|nr:hypothetical protein [Bradyrhizobium sp. WSM2793]